MDRMDSDDECFDFLSSASLLAFLQDTEYSACTYW